MIFSHWRAAFTVSPCGFISLKCNMYIKNKKIAIKSLNLYDATEITQSPNKTNIKLSVFKVPTSIKMAMTCIVDGLDVKKRNISQNHYLLHIYKGHIRHLQVPNN